MMDSRADTISPEYNAFRRSVEIEMAQRQAQPLAFILGGDLSREISLFVPPVINEDSGKELCGLALCVRTRWANVRAREIFQDCMWASQVGALSLPVWMLEGINKRGGVDGAFFKYKELSPETQQILEDSHIRDEWVTFLEAELRGMGLEVSRGVQRAIIFEESRPWKRDSEGKGLNYGLTIQWGHFDISEMKPMGKY